MDVDSKEGSAAVLDGIEPGARPFGKEDGRRRSNLSIIPAHTQSFGVLLCFRMSLGQADDFPCLPNPHVDVETWP